MAEAEELTAAKKRTSSVVAVGDGGASTPSVVLTKRGSNLAPLPVKPQKQSFFCPQYVKTQIFLSN